MWGEGEFVAPRLSDARGPCPALNALANHGHLPRDGRRISRPELEAAVRRVYNTDAAFLSVHRLFYDSAHPPPEHAKYAVMGPRDPDDCLPSAEPWINLDELHKIEHDVSFTRRDRFFGDNSGVDPDLVATLLAASTDGEFLTADDVARHRAARFNDSVARNPSLVFGLRQREVAFGETALALQVLGRDGKISVAHAESFFLHERIPHDWVQPDTEFNSSSILPGLVSAFMRFEVEIWTHAPKIQKALKSVATGRSASKQPVDSQQADAAVEYDLTCVPSEDIHNFLIPGNDTNMDPRIAAHYHGIFYIQGASSSDKTITFANPKWHGKKKKSAATTLVNDSFVSPVHTAQLCGFVDSSKGRQMHEHAISAESHYALSVNESGELLAKAESKLPKQYINFNDEFASFTAIPVVTAVGADAAPPADDDMSRTVTTNLFTRRTLFLGYFASESRLVRIVNGDGTKTPEFDSVYMKDFQSGALCPQQLVAFTKEE
ncbi:hypothetical protein HDU84_005575 [Entophlyctis sp. JEL0112]|nr:hypothetical protein HDU84_005575 [Entophlyctis sp. JEL0112]